MTDHELKKLSRTELLELFLAQMKENEQLRTQLEAARAQLAQREIDIDNAGSIAEASLQLNGVFQAAQAACQQYIENIERLHTSQEQRCAQMERDTKLKCERMVADAESQAQTYWDNASRKVQELSSSCAELRAILEQPQRLRPRD